MVPLSVHAHYDGKHILLDEPLVLTAGQRLLVTVAEGASEARDYHSLAVTGLAGAYGDNEPEYSEADLRP